MNILTGRLSHSSVFYINYTITVTDVREARRTAASRHQRAVRMSRPADRPPGCRNTPAAGCPGVSVKEVYPCNRS